MRKIHWGITVMFGLVSIALVYSCKKNENLKAQPQGVTEKADAWLNKQKRLSDAADSGKIAMLINALDYAQLTQENSNKDKQFIRIPLKPTFKIDNGLNDKSTAMLLLKADEGGHITKGYIVQYIPKGNGDPIVPAGWFTNIYNSQETGADGRLLFRQLNQKPSFELDYEKGKMVAYSKAEARPRATATTKLPRDPIGPAPVCTDWYWVTTTLFADGHTETSSVFAFTTCVSGYNGSTGQQLPDCCLPDGDMNPGVTMGADDQRQNCGMASTDPVTGRLTKTCIVDWRFGKNHLLLWNWNYRSYETSKVEMVAGKWKFVPGSIAHVNVAMEGSMAPCISFSCAVTSAIGSVNGDRTQAAMDMTIHTTFNVSGYCCPICQPRGDTYMVRTFWYAA